MIIDHYCCLGRQKTTDDVGMWEQKPNTETYV